MALPTLPFEHADKETKDLAVELIKRVNDSERRIRIIEQRIDRLENAIGSLQDNSLTQVNDLKLALEKISNKLVSISEKLMSIEMEMLRFNKELSKTATKRELKQIETFVELINPVTAKFITKDEVERVLDDRLAKLKKDTKKA